MKSGRGHQRSDENGARKNDVTKTRFNEPHGMQNCVQANPRGVQAPNGPHAHHANQRLLHIGDGGTGRGVGRPACNEMTANVLGEVRLSLREMGGKGERKGRGGRGGKEREERGRKMRQESRERDVGG